MAGLRSRILVTGASGQVGEALTRVLAPLGELRAPGRGEVDLSDPASIRSVMRAVQPRWIVNAAAYTAVDKAESESALAFAVNAAAPGIFAEEAKRIGAALIHFSTDYVFDGSKATPYNESDPTGALNVYGRSKLAGEAALTASGAAHIIFRTSWVFGATGKNFLVSILRLARERECLRIVADQRGAPTWSFDLARMTAHVIGWLEQETTRNKCLLREAVLPVSGIYHATGAGETTWYGFASQAIAEVQKLEPSQKLAQVEPIPSSEYPTPAKRPLNSRLDCSKLERVFDWRMPYWHETLSKVIDNLLHR